MTTATVETPRWSSRILCNLGKRKYQSSLDQSPALSVTHRTSSRVVVDGNSGPHQPPSVRSGFCVTGEAVPYGDPRTLAQKMK